MTTNDNNLVIAQEWNGDLIGFVLTLSTNKKAYVQYDINDNPIHGNFGKLFPVILNAVDENKELNDKEMDILEEYINSNNEILEKINDLKHEDGIIMEK